MTLRARQIEFTERGKAHCSLVRFYVGLLVVLVGALSKGNAQNLQTDITEILAGATVYAQSCANQNCHGAEGKAGRAATLAGRGFERDYIMKVTREGIPETAMPGWEQQLSLEEMEAVVTYVTSLHGSAEEETENLDPDRPWLSHPGRALFFDPALVGACGSCHLFDGWGVPVAPQIEPPMPESVAELRDFAGSRVETAQPTGEGAFPAIPLGSKRGPVRVYDLSAKLPVLRTFPQGQIKLAAGADWKHSDVVAIYTVDELDQILSFLRQASAQWANRNQDPQ